MSLGAITVGLGLLFLCTYVIVTPWRTAASRSRSTPGSKMAVPPVAVAAEPPAPLSMTSQRDAVYAALAELDIDHDLGKLNADDYQRTRAALLTQAVGVLQKLDQAQADLEKEVETLVQSRLKSFLTCRNCGGSLEPDDKFCYHCGKPTQVRCPSCNAPVAADDRFCRACGTALG
jgi:hypothetical protein